MVQLIISLIIVAVAVGITVYRVIQWFSVPASHCHNCTMGSGGCSLDELKTQIKKKKVNELTG